MFDNECTAKDIERRVSMNSDEGMELIRAFSDEISAMNDEEFWKFYESVSACKKVVGDVKAENGLKSFMPSP
jgi:hypothetical protein